MFPKRSSCADILLRLAVFIQCVGSAWPTYRYGSTFGAYLFMGWGVSDEVVRALERGIAYALVTLGVVILFRPAWRWLVPVALWFALLAYAAWRNQAHFGFELSLPAAMGRIALPLTLAWFAKGRLAIGATKDFSLGLRWFMRLAVAFVFFIHGVIALMHHPEFVDYIIGSARVRFGISIRESVANIMLTVIGVLDILAAVLLLIRPWRWILIYMAFWGFITALSRVTHGSMAQWYEVALRVSHFILPLVLVVLPPSGADRQKS